MKMYFRSDFERDFKRAFDNMVRRSFDDEEVLSQRDLVAKVVHSPAPKFYITYEMARRNVSALLKGRLPDCHNRLKMLMYADIARLTLDYQRRHKRYADNFNGALMAVLAESPAPRFYINEKSAYNLLCSLQRRQLRQYRNKQLNTIENEK